MKRHAKADKNRLSASLALLGISLPLYMYLEAHWVRVRHMTLPIRGLPQPWSGITVLHLSDVHAGAFALNLRVLDKVVCWAEQARLDLVLLTGDILTGSKQDEACLALLGRLKPSLGMFAVTGNHEYGITAGFSGRPRDTRALWRRAGITLLDDTCMCLPPRSGKTLMLCGADYLSDGYPLLEHPLLTGVRSQAQIPAQNHSHLDSGRNHFFPILLIHRPPAGDSPLAQLFPLGFAGHTHGGQLRFPTQSGLRPLHMPRDAYLSGVYEWGAGKLVVSAGLGVSFLPFRLFSRPEATLWRLTSI